MRIACENCRTAYEARGTSAAFAICPYCDHVNRPRSTRSERDVAPEVERDPLKTMLFSFGASGGASGRDAVVPESPPPEATGESSFPARPRMELAIVEQGRPVRVHAFHETPVTIGRGSCDVQLQDPEVSRAHCAIELHEGLLMLRDLRSTNGTRLNGELVLEHLLADADEIRLGSTVLRLRVSRVV